MTWRDLFLICGGYTLGCLIMYALLTWDDNQRKAHHATPTAQKPKR